MAIGTKTGGKNFGPDNPSYGRPRTPELVKKAMRLNREEFLEIVDDCLNMNKDELNEAMKSPDTPMKKLMVVSVIHHAVIRGDPTRYDFLLDRLIGRAPSAAFILHASVPKDIPRDLSHLTPEELSVLRKAVSKSGSPK